MNVAETNTRQYEQKLEPELLRLIGVMTLGAVMALLDATIVNVGIETLASEFEASIATIGWVTTGYILAFALAIPISGWAGERFGVKRVWISALSLFVLGSALAATAWSVESLIAFRVVQGLGGGMLEPTLLTAVATAAGPRRAGRVMGLVSIPMNLGPILGPSLGGLLLNSLAWQWMFLINLPVGVAAIWLAIRMLPADPVRATRPRLDAIGLALLSPGFAALLFGLSRAGEGSGFGARPVVLAFGVGLVLLGAYLIYALRSREPALIDVRLFRNRGFAASVAVMFLVGGLIFAQMFLVPLYYQDVRGYGVLGAGLLLVPQGIGAFIGMPLASRSVDRLGGRRFVPFGALLVAIGMSVYAFAGEGTSIALLGVASFLAGFGAGFVAVPAVGSVYRTVPEGAVAQATGAMFMLLQLGASLSVATVVVVLQRELSNGDPGDAFGMAFRWIVGAAVVVALAGLALPGRVEDGGGKTGRREDGEVLEGDWEEELAA